MILIPRIIIKAYICDKVCSVGYPCHIVYLLVLVLKFLNLQKGGVENAFHRSRSVPDLIEGVNIKQLYSLGGGFRVIPTTTRTTEDTTSSASPPHNIGKVLLSIALWIYFFQHPDA